MTTRTIIIALLFLMAGTSWATCNPDILLTKPDSIYLDNHNGTITDRETGLTWDKCSYGQVWIDNTPGDGSDDQCDGSPSGYSWLEAFDAAQLANNAAYRGQSDWRIPNIKELRSLVETSCSAPSINTQIFPGQSQGIYSSSTKSGNHGTGFYIVDFMDGRITGYGFNPDESYFIRLVRDTNQQQ